MADKSPHAVSKVLQTLAQRPDQAEEELIYDPHTGVLEVARKGEVVQDRDRVPATEMAREGFFT
jgi:hypothetical protein